MDIAEITETIENLENANTSFDNCMKLASLYIVKERLDVPQNPDNVESELNDILPSYTKYVNQKRKYQLNEVDKSAILKALSFVCTEIKEFLFTLFSCTDDYEEREQLMTMIKEVWAVYIK